MMYSKLIFLFVLIDLNTTYEINVCSVKRIEERLEECLDIIGLSQICSGLKAAENCLASLADDCLNQDEKDELVEHYLRLIARVGSTCAVPALRISETYHQRSERYNGRINECFSVSEISPYCVGLCEEAVRREDLNQGAGNEHNRNLTAKFRTICTSVFGNCNSRIMEDRLTECLDMIGSSQICRGFRDAKSCLLSLGDDCLNRDQRVALNSHLRRLKNRMDRACADTAIVAKLDLSVGFFDIKAVHLYRNLEEENYIAPFLGNRLEAKALDKLQASNVCGAKKIKEKLDDCLGMIRPSQVCSELLAAEYCLISLANDCLSRDQRDEINEQFRRLKARVGSACAAICKTQLDCSEDRRRKRLLECMDMMDISLGFCSGLRAGVNCLELWADDCLNQTQREKINGSYRRLKARLVGLTCTDTALGNCSDEIFENKLDGCLDMIDPSKICSGLRTAENCVKSLTADCLNQEQRNAMDIHLRRLKSRIDGACTDSALEAKLDLSVKFFDIQTAFLHSNLDVYKAAPPGNELETEKYRV